MEQSLTFMGVGILCIQVEQWLDMWWFCWHGFDSRPNIFSSHQVLELKLDFVDPDGRVEVSERELVLVRSGVEGDVGDAGQAEVVQRDDELSVA